MKERGRISFSVRRMAEGGGVSLAMAAMCHIVRPFSLPPSLAGRFVVRKKERGKKAGGNIARQKEGRGGREEQPHIKYDDDSLTASPFPPFFSPLPCLDRRGKRGEGEANADRKKKGGGGASKGNGFAIIRGHISWRPSDGRKKKRGRSPRLPLLETRIPFAVVLLGVLLLAASPHRKKLQRSSPRGWKIAPPSSSYSGTPTRITWGLSFFRGKLQSFRSLPLPPSLFLKLC